MKPDSPAAQAKIRRLNAIQNIIQEWEGACAPTLDEVAEELNRRHIYTAQQLEWTGPNLYYELYRNKMRLRDLTDKPIIGMTGETTKRSKAHEEQVLRVVKAIKQFLVADWIDKTHLPPYTAIANYLNCGFIQVSDDDAPWDADTVHEFMYHRKLKREDFVELTKVNRSR